MDEAKASFPELNPEQWSEIKAILIAAMETPTERRHAFLTAACRGDQDLYRQVADLLEAEGTEGQTLQDSLRHFFNDADEIDPLLGQRIGAYRLARMLGSGGMGHVFLGLRDHDYEQKVAVKVLKRGVDAHYFQRERQIVAELNHANITRILDGGTTEDGRPYFVMELVDGERIDHYCDNHHLTIRQRLKMFLVICDAVSHAHRRLVIHRDIKPANILVTADGSPKLLDFGIAGFLNPGESQHAFTQTGSPRMTPLYASPEQIRGDRLATTTDVYSLGVLLYGLLTGRLPYDLSVATDYEIYRAICEREPTLPSASIAKRRRHDGVSLETEKTRGLEPHALKRILKGDLDYILLKTLAKDPADRFGSVAALAADIRRYLDGRLVTARPATYWYRTYKIVRRYWGRLAFALAALGLVVGFAVHARLERNRAERKRAQAEELINFMVIDLRDRLRPIGKLDLLEEVGVKAVDYFAQLSRGEKTPEVVGRQILALQQIGEVQLESGQRQQARTTFTEASKQSERLVALAPNYKLAHLRLAHGCYYLGLLAFQERAYDQALSYFQRYFDIAGAQSRKHPDDPDWLLEWAYGHTNLGAVLMEKGEKQQALDLYEQSIQIQEQIATQKPEDQVIQLELATAYAWLGLLLRQNEQPEAALTLFIKARDLTEKLVSLDPDHAVYREHHADQLTHLARTYLLLENLDQAKAHMEQALSYYSQRLVQDPANKTTRQDAASLHLLLAVTLRRQNALASAKTQFQAALSLFEDRQTENLNSRIVLAKCRIALADMALNQGEPETTAAKLTRALSDLEDDRKKHGGLNELSFLIAKSYYILGKLHQKQNRPEKARESWRKADAQFINQDNANEDHRQLRGLIDKALARN